MPNSTYKGQKFIKEVTTKIIAIIPSTIARVPEITFPKYKTAIAAATKMRIALSIEPMFFFITGDYFNLNNKAKKIFPCV